MASLPLHALKIGVEKIPDKAFEKIPFAGPRYFREKDRHEERKEERRDQDRKDQDRKDQDRGDRDRKDRERQDRDRQDRDRNRKQKDRKRRDNRDSDNETYDSYSESEYDRSPRSSRPQRSHRRSAKMERRAERPDRDYDSDQGPQSPGVRGYTGAPYFPPPPRIAVDEPEEGQRNVGEAGPGFVAKPYNPAEYGERPGSRDSYYAGHPQEQQSYSPPPPPGGPSQQPVNPAPSSSTANADYRSSVADRYRPSSYDQNNRSISPRSYAPHDRNVSPSDQQNRGSPNPTYPSALTVYPPAAGYDPYPQYADPGYNTYQPQYDDEDEPRRRRHQSRSRSRSRSRNSNRRSRSRSRVGGATDKAKDGFEKHKKEMGVGALGALAGGIIGKEFGGKKGSMAMIIGAALGGLGGGLYERKSAEKKSRMKAERRDSRHESRDGYDSY